MPPRTSQRAIRNHLAGLDAFANGTTPVFEPQRVRAKTGKQKETPFDKANAQSAALEFGSVLYKNRRGFVRLGNGGGMFPYGLGPNGTGDRVGYTPVTITASMVGKRMPIYTEIESKTDVGRLEPHQRDRIAELALVNAICGVARGGSDAADLIRAWLKTQELQA
jgi:hypothetical protein